MSARFTLKEAVERNWITKQDADELQAKSRKVPVRHTGRKRSNARPAPERMLCSIDGDLPQEKLWRACVRRWSVLYLRGQLQWEYPGAVPGRRYRLDIAFTHHKLAVETDGWEFHGKHLSDFKRDRERDRLLVRNGWRVLRFYTAEISAGTDPLLEEIQDALEV